MDVQYFFRQLSEKAQNIKVVANGGHLITNCFIQKLLNSGWKLFTKKID